MIHAFLRCTVHASQRTVEYPAAASLKRFQVKRRAVRVKKNASKYKVRASVLIQSEPIRLLELWRILTNAGGANGDDANPNADDANPDAGDAIPSDGDASPSDGGANDGASARDGPSAPVEGEDDQLHPAKQLQLPRHCSEPT